jgi:hypothetical protein
MLGELPHFVGQPKVLSGSIVKLGYPKKKKKKKKVYKLSCLYFAFIINF